MVLPLRIELRTSPLPRECSTTELRQRAGDRSDTTNKAVRRRAIIATRAKGAQGGARRHLSLQALRP